MKKIPSVFLRDWNGDRSRVTRDINSNAAWVLAGDGVPTRKWDGTAILIEDGVAFKRYERSPGKAPPEGFRPAQEIDPDTGKQPGWVPTYPAASEDRWLYEAIGIGRWPDGTYELVGPKVQGNPENLSEHQLLRHGAERLDAMYAGNLTYGSIRNFLIMFPMEGIVWHHPDGRMAKIKRRDFGLPWPVTKG